jgi:uncharacterized membrane protein
MPCIRHWLQDGDLFFFFLSLQKYYHELFDEFLFVWFSVYIIMLHIITGFDSNYQLISGGLDTAEVAVILAAFVWIYEWHPKVSVTLFKPVICPSSHIFLLFSYHRSTVPCCSNVIPLLHLLLLPAMIAPDPCHSLLLFRVQAKYKM